MVEKPDYSHLRLLEGEFWNLGLHPKQTYLGRSVVELDRELTDPLECTKAERDELWEVILPAFRAAIVEAFQPVRINYGHQANKRDQVHWHLIPRYENPNTREFEGIVFTDVNIGHNYSPHSAPPSGFDDVRLEALRDFIRSRLPT